MARLPYQDVISPSMRLTSASGTSAATSGMCLSRKRNGSLLRRTRSTLPEREAGSTPDSARRCHQERCAG